MGTKPKKLLKEAKKSPINKTADGKIEKPDWKTLKVQKKNLLIKRKFDGKPFLTKAKELYEKLKCKTTKNKDGISIELHTLLKTNGGPNKFVMAHDTSRIVQCLLKYGTAVVRHEIAEELFPLVAEMSTSKYAVFCLRRMLKYGNQKTKEKIVEGFFGKVMKLSSHAISSSVVETAYNESASTIQRLFMKQEFYGDLFKTNKDSSVKTLQDAYKKTPEFKSAILQSVKSNLIHVLNKKLLDNTIVHEVLYEFLNECTETDREEIGSLFTTAIPFLITSKAGVQSAVAIFYHSPTARRRAILKSLKEHLFKIATHEHGHALILAILNATDDTKAIKKIIFDPLLEKLEEIVANQWGRRVIVWFFSPCNKDFCHPQMITFFEEGYKHGKKDKEIRSKEILEQIEKPVVDCILKNPDLWVSNGSIGLVTAVILKSVQKDCFEELALFLAEKITDVEWTVEMHEEKPEKKASRKKGKVETKEKSEAIGEAMETQTIVKGIEDSGLHLVLKKIIKEDKNRLARETACFSDYVIDCLTSSTVADWIPINRACFLLVNLYENASEASKQQLKTLLQEKKILLKKQNHAAARIVLEKVL